MPDEIPTVRCKFQLDEIKQHAGNPVLHSYVFNAVYGDTEVNKRFWKYTPSGQFTVGCVNPQPWLLGDEVFIDISLVPKQPAPAPAPEVSVAAEERRQETQ